MLKLTDKDIDIKYEGAQLLEHITAKYSNVPEFMQKHNIQISEQTMMKYLHSKKIKFEKTRSIFVLAFNKEWGELIVPPEVQIEGYLKEIEMNMRYYMTAEDVETVNKLVKACKSGADEAESDEERDRYRILLAIAYNFKSRIYACIGESTAASEIIDSAIEICWKYRNKADLYYMCYTTAGAIESSKMKYDSASNYFENALKFDKGDIPEHLRYDMYFSYAFNLLSIKQYAQAIRYIDKCISCCGSNTEKLSKAYLIKGLITKRKKAYDDALYNYNRALEFSEGYNKAIVFNNIAMVYREKGDIENAFIYADKAVELSRDNYILELIYRLTLVELNQIQERDPDITRITFEKLRKVNNFYPYTQQFIDCIEGIIKSTNNKKAKLLVLYDEIFKLINTIFESPKHDHLFKSSLSWCLVKVMRRLDRYKRKGGE